MKSVLLIDDSTECCRLVSGVLAPQFNVRVAMTLKDARTFLEKSSYDLILLDVSLPDGNGFDFLSELRPRLNEQTSVIFLSGKNEPQDKITGWNLGADDYITKPFSLAEFTARISNRALKVAKKTQPPTSLEFGCLVLDVNFREAHIKCPDRKKPLALTPIEFKLLSLLTQFATKTLSRDQLIQAAWGEGVHITERTVDKHISLIRKKISDSRIEIKSVSRFGYKILEGEA